MVEIKKNIISLFKGLSKEKDFKEKTNFIILLLENKFENDKEKIKKNLNKIYSDIEELHISEIDDYLNKIIRRL